MFLSLNFFRHDWVSIYSRDYQHTSNVYYIDPETGKGKGPLYIITRPRANERYVSKFRVYRLETLDLKRMVYLVSLHKTIYDAAIQAAIDFNRKQETLSPEVFAFRKCCKSWYEGPSDRVERFMKKLPDRTVTYFRQNSIGLSFIEYEDRIGIL